VNTVNATASGRLGSGISKRRSRDLEKGGFIERTVETLNIDVNFV
jgi:hypothetical protein